MDVKNTISFLLRKALADLGIEGVEPLIDTSADESHGDYSSNIAMAIFSSSKFRTPLELAQKISQTLNSQLSTLNLEKVEVVLPGFINFWLSRQYLLEHLREIVGKSLLLASKGDALQGKKIMVEFADPNPFKEFHIGHLRNISLGESFCRLLEAQKAEVWRVNYQGDVGMHIAKALYGLIHGVMTLNVTKGKDLDSSPTAQNDILEKLEEKSLQEKIKILGEAYALGNKAYEEDEEAKKEIQALNIKIYKNDPSVKNLWGLGRKWSLEHFEEIYKRVGTAYKRYYFESEVAGSGREIVLSHIQDGTFERHDGAVVFRGEKNGLHTRVFVTKEDYATYEAKDLALAKIKHHDFAYDRSIIITDYEQSPYFKVILAAMKKISPELAEKTEHYSFGFVSLKKGKMSSRTGNIIAGEWLLDEAKVRIKKEFREMDEETAEKVAVGAVKYSMLKFSTASDISFSFDESISLEGNSGPYIQYTYARTQSVLAKIKNQSFDKAQDRHSKIKNMVRQAHHLEQSRRTVQSSKLIDKLQPEELSLLRTIHRFPEIVGEAGENFAPNLLCNYLFDLAQKFNLFYQKHKILEGDNREFRLALTIAVGQTLKNGLHLLGIAAPDRM